MHHNRLGVGGGGVARVRPGVVEVRLRDDQGGHNLRLALVNHNGSAPVTIVGDDLERERESDITMHYKE